MNSSFANLEILHTAARPAIHPPNTLRSAREPGIWLNDIHSQLNPTRVHALVAPNTPAELAGVIRSSARIGLPISVSGCRHAMGGQQFATGGVCIDTRALNRIVTFDRERGLIEVEAGIQWSDLIRGYLAQQKGAPPQWGIAQKQTGADNFTLGGSLGSNVHGRGLAMKPLISNIESFTLIDANGDAIHCSRAENRELFSLAIGGYGLFGVIARLTLRLVPRRKLERVVESIRSQELIHKFDARIRAGFLYGDFQFSIDEKSPDFLQYGVFSSYRPIDDSTPVTASRSLSSEQWLRLLHLGYTDRAEAFEQYVDYYLSTNGQTYWSDKHQLGPYLPDYAKRIGQKLKTRAQSTLGITELCVPRDALPEFLRQAAELLRAGRPPLIYGTVRLIERDNESFLPWARQSYACIIFNLLTVHSNAGVAASARAFRQLIDLASRLGGTYYLTYHRFATRPQVETCYPNMERFLALKRKYDPAERFQSDWHRHYAGLFG